MSRSSRSQGKAPQGAFSIIAIRRADNILVVVDGEPGELATAEPAMVRAGATPLPYHAVCALA